MERQSVMKVGKSPARNQPVRQQSAESHLTAHPLVRLQQSIGNHAVQRLISSPFIQARVDGNSPEKPIDEETDHVEDQEVRPDEHAVQRAKSGPLEKKNGPLDEDEEELEVAGAKKPLQKVAQRQANASASIHPVQRQDDESDEEVQMKAAPGVVQRQEEDEDDVLQGKFETAQRQSTDEEEDSVQGKFAGAGAADQPRSGSAENRAPGLPGPLRAGLETLSGKDLSGIRVYYNAPAPAQLNALAYTQGRDIHVGPGQEKHLAHEGWHAVQQLEGRVRPQMKVKGFPLNDDDGLEKEADVMGAKALRLGRDQTAAPVNGRFPAATSSHAGHAHSIASSTGAIQRFTAGGITVKDMKFAPKDIPADGGVTTSQASVHYSGRITAGAQINWSIIGPAFGSAIDASGKITPGAAITVGKEKERLKVKAEDSVTAGAHTFGFLNLWDAEFFQAKLDFPVFKALHLTKDPFNAGLNGAMALSYKPGSRRFDGTVRVNFLFLDDKPGAANWNKKSKGAFVGRFISVVQRRWSNQYNFINVREPKKIWKKLNPVRVRVIIKLDTAAPHFTITVHKATVVAGVVAGTGRFGPGHLTPKPAFPLTGAAETAALAAVTPTPMLFAAGSSAIGAADAPKLDFMATYLRRIKNPRFSVAITGHHQTVVHAVGATVAQKKAAIKQAKQLSRDRADKVFNVLKARAPFHKITRQGVGDTGAAVGPAWDKVDIASALPAGWVNVQAVLEHEAGHMLGVDDEYINPRVPLGGKTTHYALTMQAFGVQYADKQARVVADSASLMNGGNDIRPHHYVTLWDGLAQMTSTAASPKRPFVHADWQFEGQ